MSYTDFIADDKSLVIYRPKLNQITGSVLGTIFLQQVLYWWKKSGGKPFYKFNGACEHELYKPGDSWQEELGFSRSELETARKSVALKRKKGEELGEALVYYWNDINRKTWYSVNEELLESKLKALFVMPESSISKKRQSSTTEKPESSIRNTETTQRLHTEKRESIAEPTKEPTPTPKNIAGFNAMWGTGDNHLSTEQRAIKAELVNTIKGLVRDPRSVVNINEAADAVLELGVSVDDLKKWYSPGGWWFTQGLGKKDNAKPYAKNIFTSIDEAHSHSRPVNLTPVKLTPAAIMAQLSGLNGLKNGAKTAAWEAIPQDIRRVASLAVKVARDNGEPIYSVGDLLEAHLERVLEA